MHVPLTRSVAVPACVTVVAADCAADNVWCQLRGAPLQLWLVRKRRHAAQPALQQLFPGAPGVRGCACIE